MYSIEIMRREYCLNKTVFLQLLPIVREKTGSAELRMSNDMQFAMIWNQTEDDI